jgi:mRNA degradation ribonuclease J1/J2
LIDKIYENIRYSHRELLLQIKELVEEMGFEVLHHASGHASGEDITWAIDQIDPDYIVLNHTEARDRFAKSFENVVLVDEGLPYEF